MKLDYYYKPYGLEPESAPIKPMQFDNDIDQETTDHALKERLFAKQAADAWGKLAKTILSKNTEEFRDLVRSVNSYVYPQLKQFANKILSPDFQKIMLFLKNVPNESDLDDKMKYAKEGIEMLNHIMGISEEAYQNIDSDDEQEIDEDSLISSLLLIKRSRLEEVVEKISALQEKKKKYRKPRLYAKEVMTEISRKDLPFYQLHSLTKKVRGASNKGSSKTVPIYTPKSVRFSSEKMERERPLHVKTKNPRRKMTMGSFESIIEDDNSDEDFCYTADAVNGKKVNKKFNDTDSVTSADSSCRNLTTKTGKKVRVVCHSSKTPVVPRAK